MPTSRAARTHDDPAAGAPADVAALLLASRALVGVAARSLARLPGELTLPQLRALVLVSSRGPVAAGALAEALGVHASTLTRLVDRLESRDLVRRTAGTVDRREVLVDLTPRGRRVVKRMTDARARELAGIVERMSESDRALVATAFRRFAEAAGELGEGAWALGWSEPDAGDDQLPR